jgi:hypothetical protein
MPAKAFQGDYGNGVKHEQGNQGGQGKPKRTKACNEEPIQ